MSQHHLTPKPRKKHLTVVIGWDPPLGTYFVQVRRNDVDNPAASSLLGRARAMLRDWMHAVAHRLHRHDADDETDFLWVGTNYGELTNPTDAIALVAPFAIIPDDLHNILSIDAVQEGKRRRTSPLGDHMSVYLRDA